MKIISRKVRGDLKIRENSQYNQLMVENLLVSESVTARLFGEVKGRIVLKPGATVHLHGKVHGEILNEGGELVVYPG